MVDVVPPEKRRQMMAGIRNKDTKPEFVIRRGLFKRGFRFRLHDKKLPGRPDLVFPRYRAAVFVNGCFWHCHNCRLFKWPSSNIDFWRSKIESNVERDQKHYQRLTEAGWRILIVWECALKGKKSHAIDEVLDCVSGWLKTDRIKDEIADGSADERRNWHL